MLRRGFVFLALVLTLAFVSCEQPGNGGDPVNAGEPSITEQPQGGAWDVTTANTFSLTVTANVTDGGTLSYQWYENITNSNSGGTVVSNETSVTSNTNVTLTLQKANYLYNQKYYFYVVVTNTISDNGDGGQKTAAATSVVAAVTVAGNAISAQPPSITTQPQGGAWNVTTADTFSLTVTASVADGGTLSYQWYENTTNSTTGGTLVSGATNAALTLAKAHYTGDGERYFYVVVTNTIDDNGDGGNKTASMTSNAVMVTVTGNGVVAVNAQRPSVTTQPQGGTWNVFASDTLSLTVTASVTDGGTLSYQWYATVGPAIISRNNPVSGGTSAILSLDHENYTTDGARSYFFVDIKNTNTSVNGNQTATATSAIVTVAITGNGEFTYTATAVPQTLIGQWINYETITISAAEFSSQMQGYGGYKGNIVGHRSNGAGAGYITIQYTQNDWDTGVVGKYYVIHYKDMEPPIMWYSGAYSSSDPGFAGGGGGGTSTQEEAEKTYTVTGGYFSGDSAYTRVVKNP